jgi:hypothetical protein
MYNKAELKAMQIIADKLNWHKPVDETVETICKMVSNQQAMELDCIGEGDDFEETLLSMALWDTDKIVSCIYTWDYTTHCNYWHFLKETGMSGMEFHVWMTTYDQVKDAIAEDTFCFADEKSRQSFITFMDFMEAMGFTSGDWFAETYFWDNEYDPNDFHIERRIKEELLADDYWMDMYEAMLETQLSCRY